MLLVSQQLSLPALLFASTGTLTSFTYCYFWERRGSPLPPRRRAVLDHILTAIAMIEGETVHELR